MLALTLLLQLTVPGDFPTIQAAVDAAQPNETIMVRGGVHEPVYVDKPLTFIGHDMPWIREPSNFITAQRPGFKLDGPGSGTVAIHGFLCFSENSTAFLGNPAPGISGSGFDTLIVQDSWIFGGRYDLFGPDSPNVGRPGIDVGGGGAWTWNEGEGVENLFLSGCYVEADDCSGGQIFVAFQAQAGVRGINVFTENCTIQGGRSGPYVWGDCEPGFTFCGPSGPGVECDYGEFGPGSKLLGGRGVNHTYAGEFCCTSSAGRPVEMLQRPRRKL